MSNPKREAHIFALKQDILQEKEHSENILESVGQGLTRALGGNLIELLLRGAEYRNFICVSQLVIERKGTDRVLTFGILGQVFVVMDEEQK